MTRVWQTRREVLSLVFCAVLILLVAARLGARSQTLASAKVTFNRDIAPIVFHYCASCHRPGEAGPFPLFTYQDVKKHGHQIVAVTQSRFMPPWLPEPGDVKFADERRLSDATDRDYSRLGRPRNAAGQAE